MLVKYKAPKYCKDKLLELLTNSDNANKYKELLSQDKITDFILAIAEDYHVEVCDNVIAALCEVFGVTKTLEYLNGIYDEIFNDILGRYFDAHDSIIMLPKTATTIGDYVITSKQNITGIYFPDDKDYVIDEAAFWKYTTKPITLYFNTLTERTRSFIFNSANEIKISGVLDVKVGIKDISYFIDSASIKVID